MSHLHGILQRVSDSILQKVSGDPLVALWRSSSVFCSYFCFSDFRWKKSSLAVHYCSCDVFFIFFLWICLLYCLCMITCLVYSEYVLHVCPCCVFYFPTTNAGCYRCFRVKQDDCHLIRRVKGCKSCTSDTMWCNGLHFIQDDLKWMII